MLERFVRLSILYYTFVLIVAGLSSPPINHHAHRPIDTKIATRQSFRTDAQTKKSNTTTNEKSTIVDRFYDSSKYEKFTKIRPKSLTIGNKIISDLSTIMEKKSKKRYFEDSSKNGFSNISKISATKKKSRVVHRLEMGKTKMADVTRMIDERVTRTRVKKIRRKLFDVMNKQIDENEKLKNLPNFRNRIFDEKSVIENYRGDVDLDADAACGKDAVNESSSSLRNLFRVPKLHKSNDCSSRRVRVADVAGTIGSAKASAAPSRLSDRGHVDLMNQYEREQSLDELAGEYVHPEGHVLPTVVGIKNDENKRFGIFTSDTTLTGTTDNAKTHVAKRYKSDSAESNRNYTAKHRRDVGSNIDDRVKHSEVEKNVDDVGQHEAIERKTIFEGSSVRNDENSGDGSVRESGKTMRNSTSQMTLGLRDSGTARTTETPWPLVPGPISCDLDFQLQPSFIAKLGEFDYVVSVQLQRNPNEPADHACTGVIYNPRFIVIAPHCLNDNYGLTVTSTDDLCTIDEMIDVDYIIEHENYDPETRRNDIALIKLKSEIHKRSAKFPKEDGTLGRNFYAVGFGELMWRSFPDKISKLLQKVPVRRYPSLLKEAPGTMHITTSHMDLTGAFRGDFGGALINPRGEFVGLKSKLVKKSTDYEVYTRVRSYLPWIRSMVALHGSW